jgi:Fic family protein
MPSVDAARKWHVEMMRGLAVPNPLFVGRFRGERGLENTQVHIGQNRGIPAIDVAAALAEFQETLQRAVKILDQRIPLGAEPAIDLIRAVIDLCAWVHSEWVRIHPFANGNGRIARLWANSIAVRYELPPFVRLRPRPDGGYGVAGDVAMRGDWHPTAAVFRRMYLDFLSALRREN